MLPVAFAGDVVTDKQGVVADLRGGRTAGFLVEVGEHHAGAFGGQQQRILAADAAGGAGDDTDLALHAIHCVFLLQAVSMAAAVACTAA
ncbi:hypothetical protein D3C78_1516630 [compost metagenome]